MTDRHTSKRRKLAHELLGMSGLSALIALLMFFLLSRISIALAESYCFDRDIAMSEFDWLELERWVSGLSAVISGCSFSLLFLGLLGDRVTYIRQITDRIDGLRRGEPVGSVPLEGNNELTVLAETINDMAAAQQELRQKELALAQEKEQLIRTLSHDIRTPLTAILAYSEYLAAQDQVAPEELSARLQLIQKKAEQIRDLTGILLDGSRREPEHFADCRLLMEQLVAEFETELEDDFPLTVDLSGCPTFAGTFDVQELRRIFDNLCSNIRKYADPNKPVALSVGMEDGAILICQSNGVLSDAPAAESSRLGLRSIRRIAQFYGGTVTTRLDGQRFVITIALSDFS